MKKVKYSLIKAAALSYNSSNNAPKVIAKGEGFVAQNMIKKANECKIPIYKDSQLMQSLDLLNIQQEIPTELYKVVAQILVFISNIDKASNKK